MTFTPIIATVNQRTQIGAETTPGTGVAATKYLGCFDFVPGVDGDVSFYRAGGHKYASEQEQNTEWLAWTMQGNMDFNGMIYPLGGVFGKVSPSAFNSSATAKQWVFTPPVFGSIQPQTYTLEQGDSVRARKSAYSLFTDYGYTLTRQSVNNTGKLFAQPVQEGITLTASPTAVPLAPIPGKDWNVYLDSTSGALGTTLLANCMQVQFSFGGAYGQFYPINRANLGFTNHVDLAPTCTIKIILLADSVGTGMLSHLEDGSTWYLRVQAQGNQIASDGGGGSTPIFNTFTHDMAIKFDKPDPFADTAGAWCQPWNAQIVEDFAWGSGGQAQVATVVNLITSL